MTNFERHTERIEMETAMRQFLKFIRRQIGTKRQREADRSSWPFAQIASFPLGDRHEPWRYDK